MHNIPIDYDAALYEKARSRGGATDERLFADYFDAQYEMLKALKPPVVGHFDLIRLKSDDPERSFASWDRVWQKILRNLEFVVKYGGALELNSAALRKGMSEPYPKAEICKVSGSLAFCVELLLTAPQAFLAKGGRFVLSDDSLGVDQVVLNFGLVIDFVDDVGIPILCYFRKREETTDERFRGISTSTVSLSDLRKHAFWT